MSHALLSPSSASRWLVCTKSARLEETFPDSESSYAAEGTTAHLLAELLLKYELKRVTKKQYKEDLKAIQAIDNYTAEMMDYCNDYVTEILSYYNVAKKINSNASMYTEQEFDLSEYAPEGFGTSDDTLIYGYILHIFDLKYGKGVPVSAENNSQLKLYALGALLEFGYAYDIEEIKMTIIQPRIENISTVTISVKYLLNWAETKLRPQAKKAFAGEGEFVAGSHCQFCKAKPVCKAHHDYQMDLAKFDFADPALIEDEQISFILDRVKDFEAWIVSVKEYALNEALNNGKVWPNYKLVQGRSVRKYSDEDKIYEVLYNKGYAPGRIGRFKLFGLTEMQKEIGKEDFEKFVTPLLIKPPGKPVLVHESDKRPVFNSTQSAQKDFENLD